ncbi:hypothetical protein KEM60_02997 [Austwickia sp. TVS 96-490-7B]|uniref:FG-GAP repeat domain-containing protein n=1 Tax=Austwickia sp. TVS 96-490-7B TaxID=2830843 RepID=UPI001C58C05B|nr:VCBS repeat-containing protein [Austwickia sp. TVS 96-490-7B]MBW3086768.1 hypothetical protein [Austwickia sp. TVS 96-490-7B]
MRPHRSARHCCLGALLTVAFLSTPSTGWAAVPAPLGLDASLTRASTRSQPSFAPSADISEGTLRQLPTGQECPTGLHRAATIYRNGFEDRVVPGADATQGWSAITGDAYGGSTFLRSRIDSKEPASQPNPLPYWPLALPMLRATTDRTMLRYAIRGTYPEDAAYVTVNAASGWVSPSSTWSTLTVDVSDALTDEDSMQVDIRFSNYPVETATSSQVDLDDVEIYTCTDHAPPATTVRGDFTGDGIADLVTVDHAGALLIWPGTGALTVSTPKTIATDWHGVSWIGSPGDLNGDGHADMLSRSAAGDLLVHDGDGTGGLAPGRRIGVHWNAMNAIVPMGDVNGDGLVDYLARDVRGTIRRYWMTGVGGTLTGGTVVGTGFQGFSSIFSTGDTDGDGRWDVTAIIDTGEMRVYTTRANGSLWGYGRMIGTGWRFRQVSSPGDFNRDGRDDVVSVGHDGRIVTYPVLGTGVWGPRAVSLIDAQRFRLVL